MSRRTLAPLIRLRQEIVKRLDTLTPRPRWQGLSSYRDVSRSADLTVMMSTSLPSAFEHLEATKGLLPASARKRVLQEADRIVDGSWEVLGHEVELGPEWRWTVHPVTGRATPRRPWYLLAFVDGDAGGDPKFLWELNRHGCLLRLAQAAFLTEDEGYTGRLLSLLDGWMEENPPGIGINWASVLEVAIRVINWCWLWMLTRNLGCWTEESAARFLWHVAHHARHVERFDSIHHSPNTHLLVEALAMLYVGAVFPELENAAWWERRGRETLQSEFDHQVLDDGFHFERSTGYHRYAMETYLHAYLLDGDGVDGTPPAVRDTDLRRMAAASAALQRSDGRWPVVGDEDGGRIVQLGTWRPEDQGPLVRAVDLVTRESDDSDPLLRPTGDPMPDEVWWLLTSNAEPAQFAERGASCSRSVVSAHLEHAGLATARTSGTAGRWYCLVSAGRARCRAAAAHAHADLGHVEIARGSTPIVVDPGSPSYDAGDGSRERYRREGVHACLAVEGIDMATTAGPFRWRRLPPVPRVACTEEAHRWTCELVYRLGPDRRLEHLRRVILRSEGVTVIDVISGVEETDRLTVAWPLAFPGAEIRVHESHLELPGAVVRWAAEAPESSVISSVEPFSWSPTYGVVEPGHLLKLELQGSDSVTCSTNFAVQHESSIPELDASPVAPGGV